MRWIPLLVLLFAPPLAAQDDEVVVGIRSVAPFVISENGEYTGITVELWDHIARELEIEYRFEERELEELFTGVEDGSLFASAAALTITSDREARVDFSHPFYVTGLGIAVEHRPAGLLQAVLGLFSPDFLWVSLLLMGLLLFWGLLVWIFERAENREEFGGTPMEGIGAGFWWAAVTMTTVGYGDKSPRTTGGRVVGFIWMFTAIIVISFFTASIASSLTVTQLDSRVSGPQDLPHVSVGGLANSAAVAWLEDEGIRAGTFPTLDEGLRALGNGEIDAFVHDAPILRYLSREAFRGEVRVLPGTFVEQYYGIALPLDSEWRGPMNQVLLDLLASDEWEDRLRAYLGD